MNKVRLRNILIKLIILTCYSCNYSSKISGIYVNNRTTNENTSNEYILIIDSFNISKKTAFMNIKSVNKIDSILNYLNNNKDSFLKIICFERDTPFTSILRSVKNSETVKIYFIEKGVDPDRIVCVGKPVLENNINENKIIHQAELLIFYLKDKKM